jgi:glycosyltransferase involved in cell wall biosynthesis
METAPHCDSCRNSISFVVPAHNEENFLPATLNALHSAARQLKLDYEILVVNDSSSDATGEIARNHGAAVIDVELRNIGAVRNAGAQHAQYPWLIFVDADTIVPPETLSETVRKLAEGYVGGGARVTLSSEKKITFLKRVLFAMVVLIWHILGRWAAGCYMFCQRDQFLDFGGFDERYFAAEELFFSLQLKRRGKFGLVSAPVITSARKLHAYSCWQLFCFLLAPLKRFWAPLRSPKGLDILYKDER